MCYQSRLTTGACHALSFTSPLISHIIRTMSNLHTSAEQPSSPTANKPRWWKPVALILGVALILLMFIFSSELQFYWYHYRANRGDAEAQFNLALCYDQGEGVALDQAEAVRWYRRAADQGHASAQYNLGVCYSQGTGVPQDYAEAVRWFRLAADQGSAIAQNALGRLL